MIDKVLLNQLRHPCAGDVISGKRNWGCNGRAVVLHVRRRTVSFLVRLIITTSDSQVKADQFICTVSRQTFVEKAINTLAAGGNYYRRTP